MVTEPTRQVGTRVMFENERVRVWDLALAPGESLAKHIHVTDYFFLVEAGGLIRFANPDDPADYHVAHFVGDHVAVLAVGALGRSDSGGTNSVTQQHRTQLVERTGTCDAGF